MDLNPCLDEPRLPRSQLTGKHLAVTIENTASRPAYPACTWAAWCLDAARARAVREAERSVDLRLAKSLGIQADRGDDEEGIQIVIPAFQAGDEHAILLDVVADRPGPIVDVTVRYKDLVYLRNGVNRASQAVAAGEEAPGSLERDVLRGLVSRRLSEAVGEAGRRLRAGDDTGARALLAEAKDLLAGLGREVKGWAGDSELASEIVLVDQYLAALGGGAATPARRVLVDSLCLASHRLVVPPSTRPESKSVR